MARILIVDDAMFMRQSLNMIITGLGHEVVAMAENGFEAVKLYDKHKPDLVTLDITMPQMDGIEALKQIREKDPQAKVLMVSAMGQESTVIKAIQTGAMGFVVKPFQKEVIEASLKKFMKEGG